MDLVYPRLWTRSITSLEIESLKVILDHDVKIGGVLAKTGFLKKEFYHPS